MKCLVKHINEMINEDSNADKRVMQIHTLSNGDIVYNHISSNNYILKTKRSYLVYDRTIKKMIAKTTLSDACDFLDNYNK